jgi:hypothetical protein
VIDSDRLNPPAIPFRRYVEFERTPEGNTMNRLLAALTVGLLTTSAALADIPPPPPPKGKKYVSVNNEVVLGKDVSGFVFVQQVGTGPGRPKFAYEKLELTPGKATAMPAGGRYTYVSLIAVPEDAAKGFKTDAELFEALGANTVPDSVKGNSVKWTHTITAIGKGGVKTKVEGEGYVPTDKPGKKGRPSGLAGAWVAGVAAFAAFLLGGMWLAGRGRRK